MHSPLISHPLSLVSRLGVGSVRYRIRPRRTNFPTDSLGIQIRPAYPVPLHGGYLVLYHLLLVLLNFPCQQHFWRGVVYDDWQVAASDFGSRQFYKPCSTTILPGPRKVDVLL